jgi:hypothetical protein
MNHRGRKIAGKDIMRYTKQTPLRCREGRYSMHYSSVGSIMDLVRIG